MVRFKKITLEGFGSYIEPFTYKLDSPGLNIITGDNGTGKSTIFNALSWCLYKKTLKGKNEIVPWEDIQPRDFRGTLVSVSFTKGGNKYNIIRGFKYKDTYQGRKVGSGLFLVENSNIRDDLRDKADIQKEIEKILGLSYEVFLNSVLFGQNLTRVLKEKGPIQKKLFDQIFDTTYIDRAKNIVAAELKDMEYEHSSVRERYDSLKKLRDATRDMLNRELELQNTFDAEKKRKLNKLHTELKQNEKELKLANKIIKLKPKEKEYFGAEMGFIQLEGELTDAIHSREQLAKQTVNIKLCPECNQPIDANKIQELKLRYKQEYKEAKAHELKVRAELVAEEKRLIKLQAEVEKIDALRSQLGKNPEVVKNTNQTLKERIRETESEVFEAKNTEELEKKLKILQIQMGQERSKGKNLNRSIKVNKWLIKGPLSNKGLKMYIINARISRVNQKAKAYAKYLGYALKFKVDLESGNKNFETHIIQGGKTRSYDDLSGGQQQLVDLALAFSIHEVIQDTTPVNILLMDELFESLDTNNIELVTTLIKILAQNKSIHVMTHHIGFNPGAVNRVQLQLNSAGRTEVI